MSTEDRAALPEGLRRLWRLTPENARGGRPGLTVDRIVGVAIELADAGGLEAVSMARIAEQLGFTTMALYRHVSSKDELLDLMIDVAAGEPPPLPEDEGWRAGAEAWAMAQLELFRRHPWSVQIPIRGIPIGPHQVAWMEAGMRAIRESGLEPIERFGIIGTLASYIRQDAVLTRELAEHHEGRPWAEVEREYGQRLGALIDADRFPELAALLASGRFAAGEGEDEDADVTFGLLLLLDGIERYVERRRAGG